MEQEDLEALYAETFNLLVENDKITRSIENKIAELKIKISNIIYELQKQPNTENLVDRSDG